MRHHLTALAQEARLSIQPGLLDAREWIRDTLNEWPPALQPEWRTEDSIRNQWRRVLRRSRARLGALPPITGPRVLVATMFGLDRSSAILDSILMMALRLRGADPIGLLCDSSIPACEFNPYGAYEPDPGPFGPALLRRGRRDRCSQCTKGIGDPFAILPVRVARLRNYAAPDDLQRISRLVDEVPYDAYRDWTYRDIGVGEHAYASTTRALVRGTLEDDARTRWQYRRYLIAAAMVVEYAERLFAAVRPERLVATHGIYVTQGTIGDLAKKYGLPRCMSGSAYRSGTVSFFQGDNQHRALFDEPNAVWETLELTPAMDRRLDHYLRVRRGGGDDYFNYQRGALTNHAAIYEVLGLNPEKPLATLYTNLIWDAQIFFKSKLYPDMLEWLFETIRYFEAHDDRQLAIRVHPSEGKRFSPTGQPLLAEVNRVFPRLPPNVRVVSPESPVNSYALADMSRAALIYGARWAFELAVQGVPIIITGESPN